MEQLTPNTDMTLFTPAEIKRAGELLGCELDEKSIIRALIIQRDTGLSIARGEVTVVKFGTTPTVFINKQGYLAYAYRQPDYDGYEYERHYDETDQYIDCIVYSKSRRPLKQRVYMKEWLAASPIWRQKPRYMLEKTALSLALRAAFPVFNDTYSEDEKDNFVMNSPAPVKVESQPTDISVKPEPPQTPPLPPDTEQYTQSDAQLVLENMKEKGMNTDIFTRAKLPNGNYDKQMIKADFKRQMDEMKHKTGEQTPVKPPADDRIKCADCGKTVRPGDEDQRSRNRFGVPLCPSCYVNRLTETAAAENAKKMAETEPQENPAPAPASVPEESSAVEVCSKCGKPMTKTDIQMSKLYAPTKDLLCKDCLHTIGTAAGTPAKQPC